MRRKSAIYKGITKRAFTTKLKHVLKLFCSTQFILVFFIEAAPTDVGITKISF